MTTHLRLSFRRLSSSRQTSTTGAMRSNRFRLRSSCVMLGHVSRMPASESACLAALTHMPSRMTILRSCTLASCRRILSKPTSWATLPEKTIWESALDWPVPAYFSLRAATKLWGGSDLLVGRTNEAAVGDLETPDFHADDQQKIERLQTIAQFRSGTVYM